MHKTGTIVCKWASGGVSSIDDDSKWLEESSDFGSKRFKGIKLLKRVNQIHFARLLINAKEQQTSLFGRGKKLF